MVAEQAAKNLIPCVLELGGKCPAVVGKDADINLATDKLALGKIINSG